jgi:integrase
MSVLFNHACRYELFDRNPIYLVRQNAKRRTPPAVLVPAEIKALIDGLALRERTLVLLAASTGLRQSEIFGLKWGDIDFERDTMSVIRSIVYGVVGPCKTESSHLGSFAKSTGKCRLWYLAAHVRTVAYLETMKLRDPQNNICGLNSSAQHARWHAALSFTLLCGEGGYGCARCQLFTNSCPTAKIGWWGLGYIESAYHSLYRLLQSVSRP